MELLNRARSLHFEIDAQLLHIERLHNVIDRTRDLTRVKIYTDRLEELEAKINTSINEAVDTDSKVQHLLNKLTGYEKTALYRYYILGEKWKNVALNLNFCERQIVIIHKRALEKLSKIYEEENS